MSKRKFDYMEFCEDYGVLYDSDKYTKEEALEAYKEEFDYKYDDVEDIVIEEDYIKWKPKPSKDDVWYCDLDSDRGLYISCRKDDKRAFKVWRIN